MERPTSLLIDYIDTAQEAIADAEAKAKSLKVSFRPVLADMASKVDESERHEIATYLYWYRPDVSTRIIGQCVLDDVKDSKVRFVVGPGPVAYSCQKCGAGVSFGSRTELAMERHYGHAGLCETCESSRRLVIQPSLDAERLARAKHRSDLRTMPYHQYLQTPEWQATRKQRLQVARYRCQVCNSNGLLNVHHRTYERRGEERAGDLVVLCDDCHGIFHREGKLAQ